MAVLEEQDLKEKQKHDTTDLENRLLQLQAESNNRDQATLCNDVEIAGCPEVANENCTHLILTIAKKLGVELDERDVVSVERAGPPRVATVSGETGAQPRPRALAVRLARRTLRDALLRAARVRRALTTEGLHSGPAKQLYVNERLTKHNRVLFQKARRLALDQNFKFVWTREGKIFARKQEGSPRHQLRFEEDLWRVFEKTVI